MQDPALDRVPYERLEEARQQIVKRSTTNGAITQSAIPNVTWQERGPNNVGGRTRAILFDPNDATHKKVWAGSLVGGLWYTNDITDPNAGWTLVSDSWANSTITALAADPGNPQIMYAGTGDQYDYRTGGGIWKTTDGGANWTRLTATIPNGSAAPSDLASAFTYICRLAVNQSGHLFAGTQYGVVRSTDGGTSWSKVLAPNQGIGFGTATGNYYNDQVTDLEIGTDNTVFVAFNPSRVFRSLNASAQSWKEITPPNTTGDRTELALSPTSNGVLQVMYAVSRKYNSSQYSRDISWFKRSTDGGDNWSDITIPTDAYNAMFTGGNGSYAMSLSVHPTNSSRVYAGGMNWYQSADGGATWSGPILTSFSYQHNIQFQPGSNTVVALSGDNGVSLSTDWTTATTPTVASRNTGYRVAEMVSVSQKPTPGNPYLLGTYMGGAYQQTTDGLANGKLFFPSAYSMGPTFIDDDTPSIQLFATGGGITYQYDGESSTQYLFGAGYIYADDYDSQANTLYAAIYTNSGYFIRRVAGIGSTLTTTDLPLSGLTNSATLVRLSRDRTALFVGTYNGKLYKVTNLNQSTPTVTAIDNGALPQYSSPSAIDIGADDNELIITLSNFGIQSVWYTRDGGQTWTGKDQSNYGLPDMPVRSVLFNPQNRKQVMLGTELGIWSTNDITASNPGWEPTTSGMGLVKVNQLRVRPSDNRITAATAGRGVFISDALAIPYTVPSITLTNVSNNKLCAGVQVSVSFSTSGPAFDASNRFTVYLSDATGSFTNQTRIGSGTSSPITATLPYGYPYLPYGTGYRIRVASTNPEVYSGASESLAIGDLGQSRIYDRVYAAGYTYNSSAICQGSQVTINAQGLSIQGYSTPIESIQWNLNGSAISGATSSTYPARQTGTYTATIQQAGCSVTSNSYSVYSTNQPGGTVQSPTGGAPVCTGQTIPATCTNASDNATFQWSRDGSIISGATSYTLGVSQTGTYQCQITDANCTANTNTISISFQFGSALTASIQSTRGDSLLCPGYGQYVSMGWASNGFAANESAYYSYQWYRNNVAIPGATSIYNTAYSEGIYSLSVKQGACATRSNGLVVRAATPVQPTIVTSSTRLSICSGDTRSLTALPFGGSYQWQRDGVDISGATGSYYTATTSGNYTVRTTSSGCVATSAPLSLTFGNTIQPRITIDPQSGLGCRSVFLSQPAPQAATNYQWLLNGSPLPGATNSTLTVTGGGLYALQLTNGSCSGTSNPVSVVFGTPFNQPIKPIIQRAKSTALCAGSAIRLLCNANATLQWKRNGQALGSTGSTFFATQTGLYTVVATDNNGCSAESDPVDVRIGESTTAQLSGTSRISAGQSAQIPVAFSGPAPWSFTLTNGQTVQNTYQNPHILSVSPTTTTSYQLASVTNGCGTGTVQGNPTTVFVSNTSADVSLQSRVSNRTPNVGDEVEYTLTLTNDGPQDATGVEITSRLPAGLAFISATAGSLTLTDSLLRGNIGTISAGGVTELRYKARVTRGGIFATATQVSDSQTPDPDSQPNSGTGDGQDDAVIVDLRTANGGSDLMASANPRQTPLPKVLGSQPITDPLTADLSLALYTDTSLPQPGDVVNVRAVVSNRGGSVATSVAVQTLLPDGWTMANTNNVASSQNGASTVYANEVPAGSSVTLLFIVKVGSNGGIIQSQIASVVEADPDSTPGNGYTNGEDDTASLTIRTR